MSLYTRGIHTIIFVFISEIYLGLYCINTTKVHTFMWVFKKGIQTIL